MHDEDRAGEISERRRNAAESPDRLHTHTHRIIRTTSLSDATQAVLGVRTGAGSIAAIDVDLIQGARWIYSAAASSPSIGATATGEPETLTTAK